MSRNSDCYLVTDVTAPWVHEVVTIAREIDRLSPSHRCPHKFHEDKAELAHRLRKLAKGIPPCKDGAHVSDVSASPSNTHLVYKTNKVIVKGNG